jgi:hypothetical protein
MFLPIGQVAGDITDFARFTPNGGFKCYRVRSFNDTGKSPYSNEASTTVSVCATPSPTPSGTPSPTPTPGGVLPGAPQNLRVISQNALTNILTWDPNPPIENVITYKIQRRAGTTDVYEDVGTTNTVQFDSNSYLRGRKTTFRVVATNATGDSDPSQNVTIQQ